MPKKPSTEGAALDDQWTRHCLEIASRRAFAWVVLGVLAFGGQLALVFVADVRSDLPVALLGFSVVVVVLAASRRRPLAPVLSDREWRYVRVHWRNGLLVVHGERSLVLDVSAGPLARGRISRHRRAWLVAPDRFGNTVLTFRGVPRLFPARVRRR
ncbi:hypothetical protein ABZ816_32720 [Actinosynnema sp. NPDC047251]|uniref:Putative membrane protein n=1 Tax=Saccharothrix espanaensis (strain ATCC 51144 / DSM 44229 / JCM 9112 / NBRC 15066 / NRRL 15764) TaxID=1179773 RepID=K3W455_SACES|nr:hypothetical protein [Saccharothrix espanaensis]CCH27448.1 putative membrane protein [Saccharothrix espanaensis DSM 44229]